MKLYDNDAYRDEFMEFVYDLLRSDGTNDRANLIIDKFDSAPEVEAEPLLSNEPLTLEELREMDSEPVWIKFHMDIYPAVWGLVNAAESAVWDIQAHLPQRLAFDRYGKTWIAFRRKPEEETNATT